MRASFIPGNRGSIRGAWPGGFGCGRDGGPPSVVPRPRGGGLKPQVDPSRGGGERGCRNFLGGSARAEERLLKQRKKQNRGWALGLLGTVPLRGPPPRGPTHVGAGVQGGQTGQGPRQGGPTRAGGHATVFPGGGESGLLHRGAKRGGTDRGRSIYFSRGYKKGGAGRARSSGTAVGTPPGKNGILCSNTKKGVAVDGRGVGAGERRAGDGGRPGQEIKGATQDSTQKGPEEARFAFEWG